MKLICYQPLLDQKRVSSAQEDIQQWNTTGERNAPMMPLIVEYRKSRVAASDLSNDKGSDAIVPYLRGRRKTAK
ncbi:hypothetical protein N7G274_000497 [Stereocaulon virgatum]|uniref:Uncharacterized protein n=1 Tax=Stereocaulon virgatum TaxID=373712 RepID=A0ABR4ATJ7_9LECA